MEQVIFGGYYDLLTNVATEYNSLISGYTWTGTEPWRWKVVSTDGVIKQLRVRLSGAPGVGSKYTFTLMLAGIPTALTFDIAGTDTIGGDMVHEIDVTGGDRIALRIVPDNFPTPSDASWSWVFEGEVAKESLIMAGSGTATNSTENTYSHVMGGNNQYGTIENSHREVVPTAGTIKNFYVQFARAPGINPEGYRVTLRKGPAGGPQANTALTVTVTAPASMGSNLVNTVDVVAGEVLTMMIEPLNSPSDTPYARWGFTFVADIDGESIVLGGTYNDLPAAATEYNNSVPSTYSRAWTANENQRYQLGQTCTLKKLHILLTGSPGAGNKYDFSLNVVGASNDVIATVSGTDTTGDSGVLTDTVALDEYVTLKVVPDSTPDVRDAYWGFVSYLQPPWTGIISGVTNPAKIMGIPVANIAKVKGVA